MTDDDKADYAPRRSGLQTSTTLTGISTLGGVGGVAKTLVKIVPDSIVESLSQFNRYFDLLDHLRCRHTLFYLSEHQAEPMSIENVARHVTAFEVEYSPETLVEEDYAPIQQELSHEHLPRLADDGIVDFDPQHEVVRFQPPSRIFLLVLQINKFTERMD